MKIACPHCSSPLEASEEHLGMKANCGHCGAAFTVSATGEPSILGGMDPNELLARGLNSVATPGADDWLPPTPEELQRLLPQFQIESLLGRGGMGAVYKGSQARLDRPVAIKILPAELAEDPNFVARFEREAKTLAKLDHPGIVRIYDFGQTSEGHLFFAMEFVDGADLYQVIHGPGIKPEQALEIISQVCEALQFAHSQGVIHRDIKPANILLNKDSRVKIADFGLARPLNAGQSAQLTLTRVVMGTPDYMAPEQKRGEGDHRMDLYALGVMLYEMLCGRVPQGAWAPPSQRVQVDVRFDQIVIKAMQEEPERRYQHASEIKTDVERIRSSRMNVAGLSGKADAGWRPPAPGSRKPASAPNQPPQPRVKAAAAKAVAVGASPAGHAPIAAAKPASRKPKAAAASANRRAWTLSGIILLPMFAFGAWLALRPGDDSGRNESSEVVQRTENDASPSRVGPASEPPGRSPGGSRAPVQPVATSPVASGANPAGATKDQPFVNSLGMKFVPVPGTDVLFCIHETRNRDFAAFAGENPGIDQGWKTQSPTDLPITDQPEENPVIWMNYHDANAFCEWLSRKEGRSYRLPTAEEWTIAALAGRDRAAATYLWGNEWPPPAGFGNYQDESARRHRPGVGGFLEGYDDGFPGTAPVMSFPPNAFGLYDMGGNVWEWMGGATSGRHVVRGASWVNFQEELMRIGRSLPVSITTRTRNFGFRCVLVPQAAAPEPTTATPAKSPAESLREAVAEWMDLPGWNNGPVVANAVGAVNLTLQTLEVGSLAPVAGGREGLPVKRLELHRERPTSLSGIEGGALEVISVDVPDL